MDFISDLFEGFWTYQTPISFLAGVGMYHIYCRVSRGIAVVHEAEKEEPDVREEG